MFKFIKNFKRKRRLKKEKFLIDHRNWDELWKMEELSLEGQKYLINSRWEKGMENYQKYHKFCPEIRAILITQTHFLSPKILSGQLSSEDISLLVEKGDPENIRYYMNRPFDKENEIKLVKRAFVDDRIEHLVIVYSEKFGFLQSQEAESLLVQDGHPDFVLNYIRKNSKHGLTGQSEVELVKRRNKRLVRAYGKLFNWQPDAQDLLDAGWLD